MLTMPKESVAQIPNSFPDARSATPSSLKPADMSDINLLNSGSSTRLYGMRLTAALYNGAVRGQPVDSHVIIVTHQ